MTEATANSWSKRGLACISLALSLAEIVIMWGDVALVQTPSKQIMHSLLTVNSTAWVISGFGAFGFAVAGLVADSHRRTAVAALVVAVLTFFICGLQMLV